MLLVESYVCDTVATKRMHPFRRVFSFAIDALLKWGQPFIGYGGCRGIDK